LKCVPASCLIAQDEAMNEGNSIFSQLIGFLRDREFRRCGLAMAATGTPRSFAAGSSSSPWPLRN
jgi:hypothetical protein